jgi:hypothetical protein
VLLRMPAPRPRPAVKAWPDARRSHRPLLQVRQVPEVPGGSCNEMSDDVNVKIKAASLSMSDGAQAMADATGTHIELAIGMFGVAYYHYYHPPTCPGARQGERATRAQRHTGRVQASLGGRRHYRRTEARGQRVRTKRDIANGESIIDRTFRALRSNLYDISRSKGPE